MNRKQQAGCSETETPAVTCTHHPTTPRQPVDVRQPEEEVTSHVSRKRKSHQSAEEDLVMEVCGVQQGEPGPSDGQ